MNKKKIKNIILMFVIYFVSLFIMEFIGIKNCIQILIEAMADGDETALFIPGCMIMSIGLFHFICMLIVARFFYCLETDQVYRNIAYSFPVLTIFLTMPIASLAAKLADFCGILNF